MISIANIFLALMPCNISGSRRLLSRNRSYPMLGRKLREEIKWQDAGHAILLILHSQQTGYDAVMAERSIMAH